MTHPALNIGLAGLGTVGAGVFRLLEAQQALLTARTGKRLCVTAVTAHDKNKPRGIDLSGVAWHDTPAQLAQDPNVDVVVELMGGADGAAWETVTTALAIGKPVVTANKALLARHGGELLERLRTGGSVAYEAAVAGGIPVIKTLREGLAANAVRAVYGILNGTCNYILSEMAATGRAFAEVLAEAQAKGYAEADPSFDVDGTDSAHKLALLTALAFGVVPDVGAIATRGIRPITPLDMSFARELGYRIKLLGIARQADDGIEQTVEPCLVPEHSPIAAVDGPLNAVYIDGDFSGKILMTGAGAGGEATASAVVADLIDVARGHVLPLLGLAAGAPQALKPAQARRRMGSYFLRLIVLDKPGVIADVSAILRDCAVSLESVLQRGRAPGQPVPVILTSHATPEGGMTQAVAKIAGLASVVEPPHLMRIEHFEGAA